MPAALVVAALEQLARDLVRRELVELPVVAEESPHQPPDIEGAGPSISRNQIPKTMSAITAVVPKIRASARRAARDRGAADDPPQAVEPRRERERDEQRDEDAGEGDDDPQHVRAEA